MKLLNEIKTCNLCSDVLPLGPRPVLQFSKDSPMLLVGQAPGLKVHETGRPWNDASGIRLREWLQMKEVDFYSTKKIAIVPMGFCYPGRGTTGDNPPRPECSVRWMDIILSYLKNIQVTILVGSYSTEYFLGPGKLTDKIREYARNDSPFIVLPHPSPRNNIWLAKNQWFETEDLICIREKLVRLTGLTKENKEIS